MATNNSDVIVRDYTSNFSVKDLIKNNLIPRAFPDIEVNDLNLGFTGIVSEVISQGIEDSYTTAALMMNEAFITRAVLPESIYSSASLYNLGYDFAIPSRCSFALQLWQPDVLKYATNVRNSNISRYKLDKDTKIILSDNTYRLDYDVFIDFQYIDGKRIFNVYYDIDETNSISDITSKYIKHQVSSINWLVLFVTLKEYNRKTDSKSITDNLVTTNSDIEIRYSGQIAGLDLVYITPSGERTPMKLKTQYTDPEIEPFAWYRFKSDNIIILSFSSNSGYFSPAFNSKVEWTVYTCIGGDANFDIFDNRTGLAIQKTGNRFSYNASTKMAALSYDGSVDGVNKGDIEQLRMDTKLAFNTVDVLSTDHDLDLWFQRYAGRYKTKVKFFKRKDDPSGTLFSQFVSINDNTYVYPTNTLTLSVDQNQFDFINNDDNGINKEFIIKPGHLWEYDGDSKDTVKMVEGSEGLCMVTDDILPEITSERPFIFVNPFYIKIHRDPTTSINYNYLINETSWPEDVYSNPDSFYQFQLATLSIQRSISEKAKDKYVIQVICVPVIAEDKSHKYIEGIGNDYNIIDNNLRMVLIFRNKIDGETGYMEMTPIELRKGGSIVYQAEFIVYDNIDSNKMLEINRDLSPSIHSLIMHGEKIQKVFIDSQETSFHFACMMKDLHGKTITDLYGNASFKGYIMTNRFCNSNRDLNLYKPMTMMKSEIMFSGENNNYHVNVSLTPLLKYDIPLNEERMLYFIRMLRFLYKVMEPAIPKLPGNSSIDFKLYNTYGRSSNYYIGPEEGKESLWDSTILLDNVYVKPRFVMAVLDRSLYTQTLNAVINEIKTFFESLDAGNITDIHSSDLIHRIIENQPNVRYIRFLGFNDYDANKDSIFVKYTDVSQLKEDNLHIYVPEMIRVDENSIDISEEV